MILQFFVINIKYCVVAGNSAQLSWCQTKVLLHGCLWDCTREWTVRPGWTSLSLPGEVLFRSYSWTQVTAKALRVFDLQNTSYQEPEAPIMLPVPAHVPGVPAVLIHEYDVPAFAVPAADAHEASKKAQESRQSFANLGFPQQATVGTSDNKCAVGLCNGTVKPKRSKAMDMRFHWVY